MIGHIVVESDSHIHHKFSEEVGIAKFHIIQFFLCIISVYILLQWIFLLFNVTNYFRYVQRSDYDRQQDVCILTPIIIQMAFFSV